MVQGVRLIDRVGDKPVFFRGMGYSPYLKGGTPQHGAGPGNDGRYPGHLALLKEMGVNYLHVFPMRMPANFFAALDDTDLVYGQDIWIDPFTPDLLDEKYLENTLASIMQVIGSVGGQVCFWLLTSFTLIPSRCFKTLRSSFAHNFTRSTETIVSSCIFPDKIQ